MVRRKAFTLVEVLIAAVIFCLILAGVYKLFIGGSKTAGKGQWINTTVDKTRNALNLISTGIENSTYPTTIFKAILIIHLMDTILVKTTKNV